jgi:hypothetical protein
MSTHADPVARFAQILILVDSPERIDADAVRSVVARHGVACLRGLFTPESIAAAVDRIARGFDPRADRKHDPNDSDAPRRNFQKLQIGANSGTSTTRTLGRFMRVFYNPIFASDVLGMRAHFVRLAQIRNRIHGLRDDYALAGDEDGFWTCARIQQYPRGGGFMVPHRDLYSQLATDAAGLGYFQLLLLLSQKGTDYQQGGAYVEINGARFSYEDQCERGDVVVYDGRTVHGVADIDPQDALELDRFSGRAVAIASLFRVLRADSSDYGDMADAAVRRYGATPPG